jgi:ATP-dependent DNA helicase RecG
MTYNILANPEQQNITITGDTLSAFISVPGVVMTDDAALLPFTADSANLLYQFLRGEEFTMSLQTKTYLRILKDGEHLKHKNWKWSLDLHELRDEIIDAKSRKLKTKWDLIHYMPLRYVDKSNPQNITDLELDTWSVVIGTITSIQYVAKVNATIVEIKDITGAKIISWFFRQPWMRNKYHEGDEVVISGTYTQKLNKWNNQVEEHIINASLDAVGDYSTSHKVDPVYSEKVGKKKWVVTREVEKMLSSVAWIEDPVPDVILRKYDLMTRNEAYRKIHFPESIQEAVEARKRIAFDDFVRLQVFFANQKESTQEVRKGSSMPDTEWKDLFVNSLPFTFTGAQDRVVAEIAADMALPKPMRRLVHGEVGSGKSEVSLTASLTAAKSGKQVALLAPTGILATQLYERFLKDIKRAGLEEQVKVGLLHTGIKVKERRQLLADLESGDLHFLVGTHSILNKDVAFNDLGLIVIDEQHKFGTKHRQALEDNFLLKSDVVPDLLMMSATPIPRTMAQTIYGDMDLSVIDELPASRKPVFTFWEEDDSEVWESMREQVEMGHQAYVIAALVDESESEKMEDVENATQMHAFLQTSVFPEFRVGLVHGKMKPAEKNEVLEAYYKNEINILVSTSVIEVGVNVPNATVMTILNANRFGIASLHQIRGRVGRGEAQAYCYLIGDATNPDAEERLNALVASNDGFWLAEKDLEIRGEGSLFKDSQHGENDMIIANLREHRKLLEIATRVAKSAAKSDKMQDEVSFLFGEGTISS